MQKENIQEKARDIMKALKQSSEYIDYLNYKTLLANKPELWGKVNAFRRRAFEIQINQNYGQYEAYERLLNLKKDYEEELRDPLVNAFLDADYQLCRAMQNVYQVMAEELDYDIQFLD